MWIHLIELGLIIFFYFSVWFGLACLKSRNDFADVAWGPGFLLGALFCISQPGELSIHQLILLLMVAIWALRLSIYIFLRNRKKSEDFRYKKWRDEWGKNFYLRSYFQVFILQGFFLWLIGLPIWLYLLSSPLSNVHFGTHLLRFVGIAIWTVGFLFEAIADFQMFKFKRQGAQSHSIMTRGLWKYSRHPNYFGECLLWWGIYLICLSGGSPYWTVVGPITLTFLLLRVSGVPMLEKKYERNQEYQKYIMSTSSFIPRNPKE